MNHITRKCPSLELQYIPYYHMGVSKNWGGPPKSSILIGFSVIFTIHFGVFTPNFGNTHIYHIPSQRYFWVDDDWFSGALKTRGQANHQATPASATTWYHWTGPVVCSCLASVTHPWNQWVFMMGFMMVLWWNHWVFTMGFMIYLVSNQDSNQKMREKTRKFLAW